MPVVHNIAPVYNEKSRVLILGSFPSVKSRENEFFYGHPQNRFWKVTSAVFDCVIPETVDEKRAFLLENGIALWDVIAQCEIYGSSDSSIRNVIPNDISVILNTADIRRIFVNGKTAEKYYNKYIKPIICTEAVCLSSTSPANASKNTVELIKEWSVIRMDVDFDLLPHKTVGVREEGADYYERPGAYIVPMKDNKVGVIKGRKDYFFIGGGKEKGEDNEACLIREVAEETGYGVKIGKCFATAEQFKPDQTDIGYFHPYQYYYTGELTEIICDPVEKDHTLVWLDIDEAIGRFAIEMQEWAIELLASEVR